MASPYGGNRGGGRKGTRKRGGQPGNVNARASLFLPPVKDVEERRAFLDALQKIEATGSDDRVEILAQMVSAKAVSSDKLGLGKIVGALRVLDRVRLSELKASGLWEAGKREQAMNAVLAEIWNGVKDCENCAASVDQILTGLQVALIQGGHYVDETISGRREETEV